MNDSVAGRSQSIQMNSEIQLEVYLESITIGELTGSVQVPLII